jgi:3-polyprenyl-4-hydroxybenzoate decarboxylase
MVDGRSHCFRESAAELVREILLYCREPRSRLEIASALPSATAREDDLNGLAERSIHTAVESLIRVGALVEHQAAPTAQASSGRRRRRLVLGVSGAISAVDTPVLTANLMQAGFEVRIASTRTALNLISAQGLTAITGHAVSTEPWQVKPGCPVPHIDLAEWAEAVLVAPATATTLSRIAQGDCSDLVSALAIAARSPVIIVPSMNPAMYLAAAVQRNLATLRDDGFFVVHPNYGTEVAHSPDARRALLGAPPPPAALLEILWAILPTSGPAALDQIGVD